MSASISMIKQILESAEKDIENFTRLLADSTSTATECLHSFLDLKNLDERLRELKPEILGESHTKASAPQFSASYKDISKRIEDLIKALPADFLKKQLAHQPAVEGAIILALQEALATFKRERPGYFQFPPAGGFRLLQSHVRDLGQVKRAITSSETKKLCLPQFETLDAKYRQLLSTWSDAFSKVHLSLITEDLEEYAKHCAQPLSQPDLRAVSVRLMLYSHHLQHYQGSLEQAGIPKEILQRYEEKSQLLQALLEKVNKAIVTRTSSPSVTEIHKNVQERYLAIKKEFDANPTEEDLFKLKQQLGNLRLELMTSLVLPLYHARLLDEGDKFFGADVEYYNNASLLVVPVERKKITDTFTELLTQMKQLRNSLNQKLEGKKPVALALAGQPVPVVLQQSPSHSEPLMQQANHCYQAIISPGVLTQGENPQLFEWFVKFCYLTPTEANPQENLLAAAVRHGQKGLIRCFCVAAEAFLQDHAEGLYEAFENAIQCHCLPMLEFGVEYYLRHPELLSQQQKNSLLHLALKTNAPDLNHALLVMGAEVDAGPVGATALELASQAGFASLLPHLMKTAKPKLAVLRRTFLTSLKAKLPLVIPFWLRYFVEQGEPITRWDHDPVCSPVMFICSDPTLSSVLEAVHQELKALAQEKLFWNCLLELHAVELSIAKQPQQMLITAFEQAILSSACHTVRYILNANKQAITIKPEVIELLINRSGDNLGGISDTDWEMLSILCASSWASLPPRFQGLDTVCKSQIASLVHYKLVILTPLTLLQQAFTRITFLYFMRATALEKHGDKGRKEAHALYLKVAAAQTLKQFLELMLETVSHKHGRDRFSHSVMVSRLLCDNSFFQTLTGCTLQAFEKNSHNPDRLSYVEKQVKAALKKGEFNNEVLPAVFVHAPVVVLQASSIPPELLALSKAEERFMSQWSEANDSSKHALLQTLSETFPPKVPLLIMPYYPPYRLLRALLDQPDFCKLLDLDKAATLRLTCHEQWQLCIKAINNCLQAANKVNARLERWSIGRVFDDMRQGRITHVSQIPENFNLSQASPSHNNDTLLHLAVLAKSPILFSELLKAGVNPAHRNNSQYSALDLATLQEDCDCLQTHMAESTDNTLTKIARASFALSIIENKPRAFEWWVQYFLTIEQNTLPCVDLPEEPKIPVTVLLCRETDRSPLLDIYHRKLSQVHKCELFYQELNTAYKATAAQCQALRPVLSEQNQSTVKLTPYLSVMLRCDIPMLNKIHLFKFIDTGFAVQPLLQSGIECKDVAYEWAIHQGHEMDYEHSQLLCFLAEHEACQFPPELMKIPKDIRASLLKPSTLAHDAPCAVFKKQVHVACVMYLVERAKASQARGHGVDGLKNAVELLKNCFLATTFEAVLTSLHTFLNKGQKNSVDHHSLRILVIHTLSKSPEFTDPLKLNTDNLHAASTKLADKLTLVINAIASYLKSPAKSNLAKPLSVGGAVKKNDLSAAPAVTAAPVPTGSEQLRPPITPTSASPSPGRQTPTEERAIDSLVVEVSVSGGNPFSPSRGSSKG
jgi:hypothetical protein